MNVRMLAVAVAFTVGIAPINAADPDAQVDQVFAKWNSSTPGCAVGVAQDGKPTLFKAYGMADLEHDVRNTPDTIFEAGSVSKQFTAAAVLLLEREGKLSLDDPARKYIPELPDYSAPSASEGSGQLTIRQMLNHTSGLRDWGSVEDIAGWPRTTRVYTHADVLEIVNHQRALNFPSGTRWSYSNTGFNLAAVIVARVSGMSFQEFTRLRLFEPLGMSHTSWRDDYTRIVKNRAIAYSDQHDGFHMDMPFEKVYGNGGLLTTVGDLLKWNENFTTPFVGDASFITEEQQPGKFNDGRAHDYAFGLYAHTYKGVRAVEHSGSTAGYRAHLARYPEQRLSVAVLCNVSSGAATDALHAVADLYLGDSAKAPAPLKATYAELAADFERSVGLYRNTATGMALTITRDSEGLRAELIQSDSWGQRLFPMSASRFLTASGQTWELDGVGSATMTDAFGTVDTFERVPPSKPTVDELKELTGSYVSDEAEVALAVYLKGKALMVKRRPNTTLTATPVYADAFNVPQLGLVIFRREGGKVTALSVVQERVWDLRFVKLASGSTRKPRKTETSSSR
jgi:CubicO group peptidase (beta-lactamase class C family)